MRLATLGSVVFTGLLSGVCWACEASSTSSASDSPGSDESNASTGRESTTGGGTTESGDASGTGPEGTQSGSDGTPGSSTSSGGTTGDDEVDTGDSGASQGESRCDDELDDDDDGRVDCLDPDCRTAPECEARIVRVATFNVFEVGTPDSEEFDALARVLERLDADVVCLQEVGDAETPALEALAVATGYEQGAVTRAGEPGTGEIRNACLSRFVVTSSFQLDESDLSQDPLASDVTRPFLDMRVRVPGRDEQVTLLVVHLKAGTGDDDRFRRQVELIRLAQAIDDRRSARPDDALVVLGDFNQRPDTVTPRTWDEPPPGLPGPYRVGSDITLPLQFDPFGELERAGVTQIDATLEDSLADATFVPAEIRLDYIYTEGARPVVSEVYESCNDDGIDDSPMGDGLRKRGEPLPCGTNERATDHRPVVVDLLL